MTQPEPQDINTYLANEWLKQGFEYFKLRDYSTALAYFEEVLAINPNDHDTWNVRGIALSELKNYGEAFASFDQALKIKRDDHIVWNNRGGALLDWQGSE